MKAKAPPRRLRDDFFTAVEANSGHLRQIAEFPQLLDPTWCVAFYRQRFIIDRGIMVRHLAREQHEHRLENFMADGDNRPLGPPTTDQVLETALELTGGSYRGPGDLAQQGADVAIAWRGIALGSSI